MCCQHHLNVSNLSIVELTLAHSLYSYASDNNTQVCDYVRICGPQHMIIVHLANFFKFYLDNRILSAISNNNCSTDPYKVKHHVAFFHPIFLTTMVLSNQSIVCTIIWILLLHLLQFPNIGCHRYLLYHFLEISISPHSLPELHSEQNQFYQQ